MQRNPSAQPTLSMLTCILLRVFRAMNCGAILLDGTKGIIHLNRRAQACLGESLTVKGGRLAALDRLSDALLQSTLNDLLGGSGDYPARRQGLALARAEKRSLIARIVPVEVEARSALDGAALIVILVDPEDCLVPSHSVLQQVFGFTPSETRVAARMVCGESLLEIADATGVSVGTVRSQTKSLFAKTETNRQAELVALLTRLAVISEEDGE